MKDPREALYASIEANSDNISRMATVACGMGDEGLTIAAFDFYQAHEEFRQMRLGNPTPGVDALAVLEECIEGFLTALQAYGSRTQ